MTTFFFNYKCPITSSVEFPFTNKRYWTEFTIFLTMLICRMAPWTFPRPPICSLLLQNCIPIVDAKVMGTSLLYTIIVVNLVDNVPVVCVRKRLTCTSHSTQDTVNNVLVYFAIVPVSTITSQTRCVHVQNRVKSVVIDLPDRSPITSANHSIALTIITR